MKLGLATGVPSSTPPPAPRLFVLRVDRVFECREQPRLPEEELAESSYRAEPAIDRWEVVVDGEAVVLVSGQLRIAGRETSNVFGERRFELTTGTLAGGRFVMHGDDAELTIYGSGVPIVSSERGRLVPR